MAQPRSPLLLFVGGKGGVGKTTCAAAAAIRAARSGSRTLLVSTDPAHSLGDALRQRLGARPRTVAGVPRLEAVELDAPGALKRWLARRRSTLAEIALRGTWLDREDVARLLALSLPGIDEIAALLELARVRRARRYDAIVVDTAPTGHTLRMLAMPGTLLGVVRVFDHMQDKHRTMVAALRGGWPGDAADALIEEMAAEAEELSASLRDPQRSEMWWVTLPEPMAIEETRDALSSLRDSGPAVTRIIVNRLTPPPPRSCRWCEARRAFEQRSVSTLRRRVRCAVTGIGAREAEPTGVRALAAVARELQRSGVPGSSPGGPGLSLSKTPARVRAIVPPFPTALAIPEIDGGLRLILFGGKGGVGKTTCAAALAVAVAGRDRSRRVQLLSTDPAHSLGDVLGAATIPRNLDVRELDASRAFDAVRHRYAAAIDAFFDRVTGGGLDASHDRRIMRDLIDLAPPGIDEVVAVLDVIDLLLTDPPGCDLLVVDTAPSGHALRLLEMPALVHDWTKALMSILLKYQPVVGPGALGAMLLQLSQGLGRLRAMLGDRTRTRFVAVTRPAALPRAETRRLLRRLDALRIPAPLVLVNAVGAGECPRCARTRRLQGLELAAIRRAARRDGRDVIVAAAEVPAPSGAKGLSAWYAGWRGVSQ